MNWILIIFTLTAAQPATPNLVQQPIATVQIFKGKTAQSQCETTKAQAQVNKIGAYYICVPER